MSFALHQDAITTFSKAANLQTLHLAPCGGSIGGFVMSFQRHGYPIQYKSHTTQNGCMQLSGVEEMIYRTL